MNPNDYIDKSYIDKSYIGKAYSAIIYISPIPSIGERISIALVYVVGGRYFFKVSWEKFELVRPLLSPATAEMLKNVLKGYEKNGISGTLEPGSIWEERSLRYLNSYNHNSLVFSAPMPIIASPSTETFEMLFKKHIFAN